VINLPSNGPAAERLIRVDVLTSLLRDVVTATEPDWGVVGSSEHLVLAPKTPPGVPRISWITYLSASYGKLPELSPSRVVDLDGMGSLIIATDQRFTASNPEHVAAAERIRSALDRARLLRRLR